MKSENRRGKARRRTIDTKPDHDDDDRLTATSTHTWPRSTASIEVYILQLYGAKGQICY